MTDLGLGADTARGGERLGKRDRLIAAARSTLYEQGIERTTIADIARAADMPLGNVYYYFKAKADLVASVIDHYKAAYETMLATLEPRRTPKARLKALIGEWIDRRTIIAQHGCPLGTLSTELGKKADLLGPEAASILQALLGWIEAQFRAMGRRDAGELAVALLAAYQGVTVLADVLDQPELIAVEGRRLHRWIDSLA